MSTNPFDKIKSRLDNPSSANAGGISSSGSAYRTRLSNITKQYDEATLLYPHGNVTVEPIISFDFF